MVPLVQLVRASDCGSECHGFESHRAPQEEVGRLPLFLLWIHQVDIYEPVDLLDQFY